MEHIILLTLGLFIGWILLAYLLVHNTRCRRVELEIIKDITEDLKKIKQEIKELK